MKTIRIQWVTDVIYEADFVVADDFNIDRLDEAQYHALFAEREGVDAECLGVEERDHRKIEEVAP